MIQGTVLHRLVEGLVQEERPWVSLEERVHTPCIHVLFCLKRVRNVVIVMDQRRRGNLDEFLTGKEVEVFSKELGDHSLHRITFVELRTSL